MSRASDDLVNGAETASGNHGAALRENDRLRRINADLDRALAEREVQIRFLKDANDRLQDERDSLIRDKADLVHAYESDREACKGCSDLFEACQEVELYRKALKVLIDLI